jgi:ferric-dicitrate binding protein FerR (iron transport regulator)
MDQCDAPTYRGATKVDDLLDSVLDDDKPSGADGLDWRSGLLTVSRSSVGPWRGDLSRLRPVWARLVMAAVARAQLGSVDAKLKVGRLGK